MSVTVSTDSTLPLEISTNSTVILTYHSRDCGPSCEEFMKAYEETSHQAIYEGILFLKIDLDENPAAKKYLSERRLPVVTIYKEGLLLYTVQNVSTRQIGSLLENVLKD
jgi:hypothetical protein